MRIEIWSDVVCPWCYIGKRHLEQAIADFAHRDDVQVEYRSFELDPSAPQVPVETTVESLAKKFGTDVAGARELMTRADGAAAAAGLHFQHADTPHARTVDAHRLLHLAKDTGRPVGLQAPLKEALLAAYFARGESMGDHAVLRRVAVATGLDAAGSTRSSPPTSTPTRSAPTSRRRAPTAPGECRSTWSTGPTRSRAPSPPRSSRSCSSAPGRTSHPPLEVVGGATADACGPDGCAI